MTMQLNGPTHVVPAGVEYTEGMEGRSIVRSAETAAGALAAHSQAAMQARIFLARTSPRDMDRVRILLIKECRRLSFAKAARYAKPVGRDKVTGWSVRFTETAYRLLGNCMQETVIVFDSDRTRGLAVRLVDLETNNSIEAPILLDKTVERSDPRGQVPLDVRLNTNGVEVFLVRATEDDLLNKQNSAVSKARRNNILQMLPADVLDECAEIVRGTLSKGVQEDPDGFKKQIVDGFATLRVLPDSLRSYLGHPIDECSPAELEDLRSIYAAIRDNETTWQAVVASQAEGRAVERPAPQPAEATPKPSKAETMASQVKARTQT